MPTADLANIGLTIGVAPYTMSFGWGGSTDNGVSVVRTLDFGDGSSPVVGPGPSTSHTFTDPGIYTVTLTIEDSSGSDTDSMDIEVTAPPATGTVTGGFTTTSPIVEGDDWEFQVEIEWEGATAPNATFTWDSSLGTTVHFDIGGGAFESDNTSPWSADLTGGTSPLTFVLTGTSTTSDASAEVTVELFDDVTPLDDLTDTIEITDSGDDDIIDLVITGGFCEADGTPIAAQILGHNALETGPWHFKFHVSSPVDPVPGRVEVMGVNYNLYSEHLMPAAVTAISTDGGDTWSGIPSPWSPSPVTWPIDIPDTELSRDFGAGPGVPFPEDTWYMVSGVIDEAILDETPVDFGSGPLWPIHFSFSWWVRDAGGEDLAFGGFDPDVDAEGYVTGVGTPDISGAGLELQLDGDDWVDLISTDLGVTGPFTCSRTLSPQGPYLRPQSGRLNFTLDNGAENETDAGQWSPENEDSPWRSGGRTLLRQGLPARASITPPGGENTRIWLGRVDEWPPDYISNLFSSVDVACVDTVDRLQAADLPALPTPTGAGETTSQRIVRVLNRIGYDLYDLDPATWNTMQATTLDKPAWDEILSTADSDGGFVWVDVLGQVRYVPRDFHLTLTPTVAFSLLGPDDDGYDPDDLPYVNPATTNDTHQQFNVIKLARTGGTVQSAIADDAEPDDFQGYRTFQRSDLVCETNRQALDLALWTIGLTRNAWFRFSKVTVDLFDQTPLATWEAVLATDLLSKALVKMKTPDGRILTIDHLVTGITWTVNPLESVYRCQFDLAAAPIVYDDPLFDGSGDDAGLDLPVTTGWY